MTPYEFIEKWRDARDEHAVAQSHFNHLCYLLGIKDPRSADPLLVLPRAGRTESGRGLWLG